MATKTLKRDPKNSGDYIGRDGLRIERVVREETSDWGRAGEVEWHVSDRNGNPIDVVSYLSVARDWFGIEVK